jgi:hypothetical protein
LSLVHASGKAFGLSEIVGAIPGMRVVRVPSRSLFLAALAGSVLAGMGVDVIARGITHRTVRRYGLAVSLLVLIVLAGIGLGRIRGTGVERSPVHSLDRWMLSCEHLSRDWLVFMSASATGVLITWRGRQAGEGWVARAIGLVAIGELTVSSMITLPVCPPGRFLGPDAVSEALDAVPPPKWSRIRARDAFYSDLNAWRDGVEKTNLGDLFQIRHSAEIYRDLYPIFDEPIPRIGRELDPELARAALDRLGVARIVTNRPLRMQVGPMVASGVRDGSPFAIISNPRAMPRAYVVPSPIMVPEGKSLELLGEVDPRSAVLMELDPLLRLEGPRQAFTSAESIEVGPDQLTVKVRTKASGLLVVADTWMPGWSATIDGHSTRVFRGDHAFRVVALPEPGDHLIAMRYRAPGLDVGLVVSLTSALVIIVVIVRHRGPRGNINGIGE